MQIAVKEDCRVRENVLQLISVHRRVELQNNFGVRTRQF